MPDSRLETAHRIAMKPSTCSKTTSSLIRPMDRPKHGASCPGHAVQEPPGRPRTSTNILLADDDPTVRDSLKDVLESEGYTVIPAENGNQALDLAAALQFDLVLLDLNMPVKNGWDTFEELTRRHPLLPIIIVTARPNQLFTAVNAGVGALLEKPMAIPTLLRTMQKLLAEPADQRLARLAGKAVEFHYESGTGK
jgi:CheY-like chemotaxis protein